jgi:GT2 family glycosyltransferase
VISAIVPTLKGQARLERNLGSVVTALEAAGQLWEVLIVDDGGGGISWPDPGVRVLAMPENRGYGPAVNAGAAVAAGEYLLVLNDDVRLEAPSIERLLRPFPDPALFAVVPAIRSPLAACGDEGGKAAVWEAGLVEIREVASERTHPTFYAVGCCFLCPRVVWERLGGFDPVFAPFLWEDVDLSYRARRRGLEILHVPEAVCHHEGSATLREQRTLAERERIGFRNRVLFHLRNLRDPALRAEAFGALCAYALFEPRPERLQGLRDALAPERLAEPSLDLGLDDRAILAKGRGR